MRPCSACGRDPRRCSASHDPAPRRRSRIGAKTAQCRAFSPATVDRVEEADRVLERLARIERLERGQARVFELEETLADTQAELEAVREINRELNLLSIRAPQGKQWCSAP